ncbi:DNA methylase [Eubacterium sp.]|uniref:Y-family DNA polymerase n=1 Tax=Eubacterium sp. TaxID=142586 RepID=UPI0025D9A07D|nr:DNA methylase [Eubacterium sp.]MCR5628244.1 DNA methylase [Eubacterium sp.]
MEDNRTFIAIDLKSFYASVECVERDLDPLKTNLVVADKSRTEKTICLAVSPSLKKYGIPGRVRLFEVVDKVKQINALRRTENNIKEFKGTSYKDEELEINKELAVDYIVAPPRMALYMDYSTRIFDIYLRYVSPEDMHIYSVDEVFMDVTHYLSTYKMNAHDLTIKIIREVLKETGITATAGIGTNMYLCKIAMDIVAKHMKADKNGVRIAELNERTYRELLWDHKPLSDFWRVGRGYVKKLHSMGLYTMGDIARCSLGSENDFYNEDMLYKAFGVNAELLIDHAWGWEPVNIKDVKDYKPETNSLSVGQVLTRPYSFEEARVVISEMAEHMALDLTSKKLKSNQLTITVGYDINNLNGYSISKAYGGEVKKDVYGRLIPKHAHGTYNFDNYTRVTSDIIKGVLAVFDREVDENLFIRRMNVCVNRVVTDSKAKEIDAKKREYEQLSLFDQLSEDSNKDINISSSIPNFPLSENDDVQKNVHGDDYNEFEKTKEDEERIQEAMLSIKEKYGKNAILRGTNFREGATARDRNKQIGGHKA